MEQSENKRPERTESAVALSAAERRVLLEEIARIGAALGAELISGESLPLPLTPDDAQGNGAVTPMERLLVLESHWPRAQALLTAMARHPESALKPRAVPVTPARSRGGPEAARALARIPRLHSALAAATDGSLLLETRRVATPDTPAQHFAAELLRAIALEAEALAELAAFCERTGEEHRARHLAAAARHALAFPFLRDLPPRVGQTAQNLLSAESVLRASPPYRALFGLARRLLHPLRFDWTTATPPLLPPSRVLWHLYEVWCFLRTAEALRAEGCRLTGGDAIRWEQDGMRLALATGRASRLRFLRGKASLELLYQPLFPSANQAVARRRPESPPGTPALFSRSHAMQPDIALLYRGRLFLLDPKFRAYAAPGEEQEDVDKMHTYRDAIARRTETGRGRRVVTAAWCLFPGAPSTEESSVPAAALRAFPAATVALPFGTAGVGALRLRPGSPSSHALLLRLLASWLQDTETPPRDRKTASERRP